jgi:hypothetical protein
VQATVRVGRPAGASGNIVREVKFGNINNAIVEMLGQTFDEQDDGASVVPTSASQSVTLTVARDTTRVRQSVMVPLVIIDDCGEWQTFIGGGAATFGG